MISFFRYTSTLEIHSCSFTKLKESFNLLKNSKTLYKTHCGLINPCFKEKKGWHRATEHAILYVKKEGILFKPLFSRRFGLQFENIIAIDVEEQKQAFSFPMRITIYSSGNVTNKIVLQSERNYLLIDALKRVYDGEIRRLE
jgi:hypothetical protein